MSVCDTVFVSKCVFVCACVRACVRAGARAFALPHARVCCASYYKITSHNNVMLFNVM